MNIAKRRILKEIEVGQPNLKESGIYIATEIDNLFNVHFLMSGSVDTPYAGGIYHGMLRMNDNHPWSAPRIFMFTESGKFKVSSYPVAGSDGGICTSTSAYHPEKWLTTIWIEQILEGLRSFMVDVIKKKEDVTTGTMMSSDKTKKALAKASKKAILEDRVARQLFPDVIESIKNGTF